MIYRDVISAVIRALASETINSAGGCDYTPKVQSSKLKGEIVGKDAAFLTDCWVFGRLHSCLDQKHWLALNARYSTHMASKVGAIGRIVAHVTSPAPRLFLTKAVTAWAYPQLGGAERPVSQKVTLEIDEDAPAWRKAAVAKAVYRKKYRPRRALAARHLPPPRNALMRRPHLPCPAASPAPWLA